MEAPSSSSGLHASLAAAIENPAAAHHHQHCPHRHNNNNSGGGGGGADCITQQSLGSELRSGNRLRRDSDHLLGVAVARVALIAPTVLNWLALAYAHWYATAEVVDSAGAIHEVARSRNYNFECVFFAASVASITAVFAHVWLTLGATARAHRLADAGVVGGRRYAERHVAAVFDAGRLTTAEWAHLGMVALDFFFAAFVVFPAAFDYKWFGIAMLFIGILPGVLTAAVVWKVLAPGRAAVVQMQGGATAVFAAGALRGTLQALLVVSIVFARLAAVVFGFPIGLFGGDCNFGPNLDLATNTTWYLSAPVRTCASDLFGVSNTATGNTASAAWMHHTNATVLSMYIPLRYQAYNSYAIIIYFTVGSMLYFAARGQGVLHDRLLTELEMRPEQVIAVFFWLLATAGAVTGAAVAWADWGDRSKEGLWWDQTALCSQFFWLGIIGVLWKDAILAAARSSLTIGSHSEIGTTTTTSDSSRVIFGSMRFPPPPEALRLKAALHLRGVELLIIDMTAGGDIDTSVFEGIERANSFLVFGTSHYGEDTGNPASTFFESKYALDRNKRIILLRMIPFDQDFDHLQARVMFGQNRLELCWEAGAPHMSDTLVDDIVRAIES
jgi:hypothetical protein